MESGCFGKFPIPVDKLRGRLVNFKYTHVHTPTQQELIGVSQITKTSAFQNFVLLDGIVVDQKIEEVARLVENGGKYQVVLKREPITIFTRYSAIGNGYVILQNSGMRVEAYRVLSQAMKGTNDFIQYIGFDTQKIFDNFNGFWMTSISGRQGHWKSGTQRGDDLEADDIIGKTLKVANKRAVGFYTRYFSGDRMKVSVSASGSVALWGSVSREQLYDYVLQELKKFMIDISG